MLYLSTSEFGDQTKFLSLADRGGLILCSVGEGAKYFSASALVSAYSQVEMKPMDRETTTFLILSGVCEFHTVLLGLTNATPRFRC